MVHICYLHVELYIVIQVVIFMLHPSMYVHYLMSSTQNVLTFRHRASCILGQAFHYSQENAFYIFNQQIYFIVCYMLDRASLI